MTIDGLLTFLTLLVAVYTVMSRAQRLNLGLTVRPIHILLICLAFVAINALEFYDSLLKLGWVPSPARWPLKPNEFAYLGILASVLVVAFFVGIAPLPRNKLHRFRDLVEELISKGQHFEMLSLMESHLDRLVRIYQANFPVAKLRKLLESLSPSSDASIEIVLRKLKMNKVAASVARPPTLVDRFKLAAGRGLGRFARSLPSPDAEQQLAAEVFRSTLLRPECIRAIVQYRPYFGLRVLALDVDEKYDFSDEYFRQLIADTRSVLYWEIENNQNLSGQHRYALPEANKLLWYTFHDARVAEALGVWEPVGEQMIAELDRLHRNRDEDRYNGPLEDYRNGGQWKCLLFVGIRFFDIMVSEAIEQNICWHMWLYYFPHITDRICRNYRLDPQKTDPDAEFPTAYSYLLYEIVSTLRHWIRKVRELPMGQENAVLEGTSLDHENGNPIKSSILALGECLRTILITENVPPRLKRYLGSIALDLYFDFVRQSELSRYSEVLRATLVTGGLYEREHEGSNYLGEIIRSLVRNDNVPHRHEDVTGLLTAFVGRFVNKFGLGLLSQYVEVDQQGEAIRLSTGVSRHAYVVSLR